MADATTEETSRHVLDEHEYQDRLGKALEREDAVLDALPEEVTWAYQGKSQKDFLASCAFECLFEGTRGGGKTDCLLMDFAEGVFQGYGPAWRGILFRQTYPQLADIVAKIMRWFPRIFGNTYKFNIGKMRVEFQNGEQLLLRHMKRPDDYWNYHGHEYPWIGWEELTNWANMDCYRRMMSCCRTSVVGIPRRIRATTNPYGIGHNAVKQYWKLPMSRKFIAGINRHNPLTDKKEMTYRQVVHSHVKDNKLLLEATPDYMTQLSGAARNDAERKAWLDGDWDITSGGMFDDIWPDIRSHVLVPDFAVPKTWRITRSFDWGSTAPFSVGWYAESDGSNIRHADGNTQSTIKGDLFRIREWYGAKGKDYSGLGYVSSQITKGIIEREIGWGIHSRVKNGVADSAIFEKSRGDSIADEMQKPVSVDGKTRSGVIQLPCEKGPGSRVNGWEVCRQRLLNTVPVEHGTREQKGFFVVDGHNPEWERTFPVLPRDEKNMDDVDTHSEDHIADEVRYRIMWNRPATKQRDF